MILPVPAPCHALARSGGLGIATLLCWTWFWAATEVNQYKWYLRYGGRAVADVGEGIGDGYSRG